MGKTYSIVIPAYNAEKYIADMIESIVNQTYSNWQMIIIDDGSTDRTGEICDSYVNDKISVHHIENKGQIGARIEGINKANCDYTLVVDADDILEKECLAEVDKILCRKEYDCVIFPYKFCDEKMTYKKTSTSPDKVGEMTQQEVLTWIINTWNHTLYNKVIRTEMIKTGAQEAIRRKVKINGDYALIIPIMCYIKDAFYIENALYQYRVYGESISHQMNFQQVIDTDYVSDSVIKVLAKHGLCSSENEKSIKIAYLHMISWLIGLITKEKFVSKDEIRILHNSEFYNSTRRYEIKDNFSIVELVELKSIRSQKRFAVLFMNIFLRSTGKCRNLFKYILKIL